MALYGSADHANLLKRYNDVRCEVGAKLPAGKTLVVPEKATNLPDATLQTLSPEVRARLAGGNWSSASPGMPLHKNDTVNTLERARADILFTDRTRVVMGEHTLVVIYGTAAQSAIKPAQPSAVLLEEGELQAAISALRSKPASSVSVKGGGQVQSKSRDTVVRTKDKRTTVSVFDGSAHVTSGGGQVDVPVNHGTSFVEAQKPKPARPLPPAPDWAGDCSRGTLLAPSGAGVLNAQWLPVPKSKAYRVEVAHDANFQALIIREEVPPSITSFRAERMPAGTYFMRVRTIDDEDFLGLASTSLAAEIVAMSASASQASLQGRSLEVSPYAQIKFSHSESMWLALDNGPFMPVPGEIDFYALHPLVLRFRQAEGADETRYAVRYRPVRVAAEVVQHGAERSLQVSFTNIAPDIVTGRLQPVARVISPVQRALSLHPSDTAGTWQAALPASEVGGLTVEVLDAYGTRLAVTEVKRPPKPASPPAVATRWATGPCASLITSSPATSIGWWAPTSCDTAYAIAQSTEVPGDDWNLRAAVRATTMLGPLGLEGATPSAANQKSRASDDTAWVGARFRAIGLRNGWSLGPALRLGIPVSNTSPNERLEFGVATSWQGPRWSWISDMGGRAALHRDTDRFPAPDRQFFVLSGIEWAPREWLSSYFVLDTHGLRYQGDSAWKGRGGLTLGLESKDAFFVGWATRVSPWESSGGRFTMQLSVGLRR